MVYKNIKFEDSPVMRSLEKLAVNKGLVKPEIITKTAESKGLSLTPTENLEENILKLCSALRASGFDKHASEVETNFFNLKRAQVYDVHKETGEDMVDWAHPDGSHQMKDVAGDALVETVVDVQKAIQKMVAKQPTGKQGARALADLVKQAGKLEKKDAINAVMVLLAQQSLDEDQLQSLRVKGAKMQLDLIPGLLSKARSIISNKMNTTTLHSSFDKNYVEIIHELDAMGEENINVKNIDAVIGDLEDIQNSIKFFNWKDLSSLIPGVGGLSALRHLGDFSDMVTGNWDQDLRDQISKLIDQALLCANTARANLHGDNDSVISKKYFQSMVKTPELSTNNLKPAVPTIGNAGKVKNLVYKLQNAKNISSINSNKEIMSWIDEEIKALQEPNSDIASLESEVNDFYSQWVTGSSRPKAQ